jgi:DNA-binding winged helix-turn-helix (wHTH) protein
VFTRDQLLREVWGYDYFGGTRTVDVHVRRIRAKLGPRCESMIGTVRQVGYKFIAPTSSGSELTRRAPGVVRGGHRAAAAGVRADDYAGARIAAGPPAG